jgi:hypothetical protein
MIISILRRKRNREFIGCPHPLHRRLFLAEKFTRNPRLLSRFIIKW